MKALSYHCNTIRQYNTTKQSVVVLFYGQSFSSCLKIADPLWESNLLLTTNFPGFDWPWKDKKLSWPWSHLVVWMKGSWICNLAPEQGGLSFLSLKKQRRKNWQITLLTCKTFFFNLFSFKTGVSQKVITDFCIFVFSCFNDFAHI